MGAREYFSFIPPSASIPKKIKRTPLRGWRFENGIVIPLNTNHQGWIWSQELESWVVPDGNIVRLYDKGRRRRLTAEEDARASAERERVRAERERVGAERERVRAEREQASAERERVRADQEQASAERERELREKAWIKLRELGIDPETL